MASFLSSRECAASVTEGSTIRIPTATIGTELLDGGGKARFCHLSLEKQMGQETHFEL